MVDIEQLTQKERSDLFSALARRAAGPLPIGDDAGNAFLLLSLDSLRPGETDTASTICYADFIPRRLVILEPVIERITEDSRTTYADHVVSRVHSGRWFWKKQTDTIERLPEAVFTTEHREEMTVSRGLWSIHYLLFGSRLQLSNFKTVSGDLFGPNGEIELDKGVIKVGMTVSISVSHAAARAVPFQAVILGTPAPHVPPPAAAEKVGE